MANIANVNSSRAALPVTNLPHFSPVPLSHSLPNPYYASNHVQPGCFFVDPMRMNRNDELLQSM